MAARVTRRIYDEFKDTDGATVRVQQSSSVVEPRIWIISSSFLGMPHLSRHNAERVIAALNDWLQETDGS